MATIQPKNNLLIAHPSLLGDETFHRAVILMCSSINESPIGFILNHALTYSLAELVPEITVEIPVYHGGPVDNDHLFFIHYGDQILPSAKAVGQNIYFGGDVEQALEAVQSGKLHAQNSRFFLGYSGWETLQLANEIKQGSWLVQSSAAYHDLFEQPIARLWPMALRKEGGEVALWANTPQNPKYN